MSHLGVIAPPFFSHFRALENLGVELIERGHQVTFIHQQDAAALLADPRLGFSAVGLRSHPPGSLARSVRIAANPGGPLGLRRVIEDLSRTTAMLCREVPAVLDALNIDALIGDQMEAAAGLLAEATGRPLVSVACALPVNREAGVPLPVMPFAYSRSEQAQRLYQGSTQVYDWLMQPHRRVIEQHAAVFGLSRRGALHECLSPLAQISQTIAGFDFPRTALPACFHHVGPLRPAQREEQTLSMSVAADRPLVFASLGTLQGQRFALFRRIAAACRTLNVQLLLAHCGGLSEAQARRLRASGATWVTDFAPQRAALQRADAVISHAGLNTVMDAIATRTPILALPIAFDQPGVAARVCHAGIGLRASARFASAQSLSVRLRQVLEQPLLRTHLERLAVELAAAGGTLHAADIVETVLSSGKPVLAEQVA
ncbi:glycosyltransferase [Pseudomonas borbori]